jgi:hypothetical protein
MARASTFTLLSLDWYAALMGINPVHFNGGDGNSIDIFPIDSKCNDFWPQYNWQYGDRVSREELADAIYGAEFDIAEAVGYWPAPKWIAQEAHRFPRHHRRDLWQSGGLNVRGARKSIKLNYGKFIQAGQRAVTAISEGAAVAYSDPDGDGYDELATITAATTITDECEIKLYFAGHDAEQEWEIRPVLSKSISGGVVTITVSSWLLFDPDLWEAYPGESIQTGPFKSIDINVAANYVTTVDIYREYTDFTATSSVFYWEPSVLNVGGFCQLCSGSGCAGCSLTTQDGCLHMRGDPNDGLAVPVPGSYDADNEQWSQAEFSVCRDPDAVKVYYYGGEIGNRWLRGQTCEPMSERWAKIIAEMATARLSKPPCSCNHVRARYEELHRDLAMIGRESSTILDPNLLSNPFGTRQGEVMAWRKIQGLIPRRLGGGAI